MNAAEISAVIASTDPLVQARLAVPVVLLVVFWLWESWQPFFGHGESRWRHAAHNLTLALFNRATLAVVFGTLIVATADWAARSEYGMLHLLNLPTVVEFVIALVLLDAWMYYWHRANHAIPLLWRFHRMHHSDNHMDVTTATRFHLGEHAAGAVLRLGFIPLVGWEIWHIVVYELLVISVTQFHHADISLGRADRWLRLLIVTPDMHKVHHSRWQPETNSNYSTVLSVWDRLARTFRMRSNPRTVELGLDEFDDRQWQTLWGMLKTPWSEIVRRRDRIHRAEHAADNGVVASTVADTLHR